MHRKIATVSELKRKSTLYVLPKLKKGSVKKTEPFLSDPVRIRT